MPQASHSHLTYDYYFNSHHPTPSLQHDSIYSTPPLGAGGPLFVIYSLIAQTPPKPPKPLIVYVHSALRVDDCQ